MAEGTVKLIKDSAGLRTAGGRVLLDSDGLHTAGFRLDRMLGEGPFPLPVRDVVVKDIWPETRRIVFWATQPALETIRAREFGRLRPWDPEVTSLWGLDVSPLYDFDAVADYIQRLEDGE
jgi:hypothetical protein